MLYPLKFNPILKERIWGGNKLKTLLGKKTGKINPCGESWEISGVQNSVSIVSNGFLKGNELEELIEVYMGDLVGEKVFEKFGIEFPLLIKFIDADDFLSIQVHPNDDLAMRRHEAYGKTEMWYVMEADENSEIITGFREKTSREEFQNYIGENNIKKLLNVETAIPGDVFFLPAGRIHAIGAGILLAEIQQTSDITYRIYDWDRLDSKGNPRELHTELALEAIDYNVYPSYKTEYKTQINSTTNILSCRYFTTNNIIFNKPLSKEYFNIDSFIIYICLEGECIIHTDSDVESEKIKKGETILIPAICKNVELEPKMQTHLLEVFIP